MDRAKLEGAWYIMSYLRADFCDGIEARLARKSREYYHSTYAITVHMHDIILRRDTWDPCDGIEARPLEN